MTFICGLLSHAEFHFNHCDPKKSFVYSLFCKQVLSFHDEVSFPVLNFRKNTCFLRCSLLQYKNEAFGSHSSVLYFNSHLLNNEETYYLYLF